VLPVRAHLLPALAFALLVSGCSRAPEYTGADDATDPGATPSGVVAIPEEFSSPGPSRPALPPTPRILFVTADFQIKTDSGIQGIMAGETVNLIREEGGEVIVQYGGVEFARPKSYFSPTFVGSPLDAHPDRQPVPEVPVARAEPAATAAGEAPAVRDDPDTIGLAAPVTEPALPGENMPAFPPRPTAVSPEERKMAELADSIRSLNERIRTAQAEAERGGKKPTRAERRVIEQLKDDRDDLSRQLTKLGKP
jgi:hypothetical protein